MPRASRFARRRCADATGRAGDQDHLVLNRVSVLLSLRQLPSRFVVWLGRFGALDNLRHRGRVGDREEIPIRIRGVGIAVVPPRRSACPIRPWSRKLDFDVLGVRQTLSAQFSCSQWVST